MTKVKFVSSFLSDEETYNYIIRIYGKSNPYSIIPINHSDFDVLVVLNHNEKKFLKKRTIAFILEPSWSSHVKLKYLDSNCERVIFHDKRLINLKKACVFESPSIMGFHSKMPLDYFQNTKFTKTRKMSYVVSSISGTDNYDFRLELLNRILDSELDIDIYGKGHCQIEDRRFKGYLIDKKDGLESYEFSIGIENSCEKNYITEKFYDSILCNTVPIYYGAPNISNIFTQNSFIQLDRYDAMSHLYQIFKSYKYENYLSEVESAKNRYFDEFNIFKIIENQIHFLPDLNNLDKIKSHFLKILF